MIVSNENRLPSYRMYHPRLREALNSLRLDLPEVVRFFELDQHAWQMGAAQIGRLFGIHDPKKAADVVARLVRCRMLVPLRSRRARKEHYSRRAVEQLIVAVAGDGLRVIAAALLSLADRTTRRTPELFVMSDVFLLALLKETGVKGWLEDGRSDEEQRV